MEGKTASISSLSRGKPGPVHFKINQVNIKHVTGMKSFATCLPCHTKAKIKLQNTGPCLDLN